MVECGLRVGEKGVVFRSHGESSEQCESAKFPPVSVILPLPKEQCPEIQNNRRSK